jgi:hypothetical protein
LHIYFEGKAFDGIEEDIPEEGVKKDPDFKPLDIKISNKGDGFNLENIGFTLGIFSLNINPDKPSIAFNGLGIGIEAIFDHTNDKVVLKPSLDVLGVLFGDQLEKEVEKWQKSLGENIKAKVTATLPFEATYEIPLKLPLSYRLENANFKPKFGIEIMADVGGGIGVDVGASASIESDYAEGKEGDEFTTTTGNIEAHLKVIIFGQKFGPETQAEVKQTGTLWESVEMQKDLLVLCAEEAYKRVANTYSSDNSVNNSYLAKLFNETVQGTWTEAVSIIQNATGVNIDAVRGVSLNIYKDHNGVYSLANEAAIINGVIAGSERAKMVHEAIVFKNVNQLNGQYQSVSGNWKEIITISQNGNRIEGFYDDGEFAGDLSGQIISGRWSDQGGAGGYGDFVLQVQENDNRLYGYYSDENGDQMDWVMDKL